MDVDFTPTLEGYTGQSKLRFWCQKVLPLVYDDSLSYYELLNKVVVYLNNTIEDVSACEDNIVALRDAFVQLQEYVNEVVDDFSPEVERVIDEMIDSGEFGEILSGVINGVIASEYDSTQEYAQFAYCLKDGKLYCATALTTGEWDSTKWRETTVGADMQLLNQKIYNLETKTLSNNLATSFVQNEYVETNGTITPWTGANPWDRTDYIDVNGFEGVVVTCNFYSPYCAWYDSNNVYVSSFNVNVGENLLVRPINARYLVISTMRDSLKSLVVKRLSKYADFYLEASGNSTDRSTDIMYCLNQYGACVLGNGLFCINSTIQMPNNTSLIGVGSGTILQLLDSSTAQVAVNVGTYCTVENMTIKGHATDLPYSSYTRGTRKGVALLGDYTDFETGTTAHNFAKISNLTITDFDHSGIWASKNDGAASFLATNIDILRCHTGINIELFSEFHSFNNTRCRWCNIAIVMQGGNNLFNNCHFDVNLKNLQIDGTQTGVINAAHSSFSNCTFCHPDNNTGDNMEVVSMTNGLIFTSCQFWYGKIKITDTTGLIITNSVIGGTNNNIIITRSKQINISNNLFKETPSFSFVQQTLPIILNANILNDGSIYTSTHGANPSETIETSMIKYGESGSIQAENIGIATSDSAIAVFIFLPWYIVGNYDVTLERVILLGESTQPTLADVSVNTKQATGFRLAIPYTTTKRTPYQVNVIYKLTSRYLP